MGDPWDVTNSDAPAQDGGVSPDFWRNLSTFGAGLATAANARDGSGFLTYGGGLAGPLGAAMLGAQQAAKGNAQARAQLGLTQAQAQAEQSQALGARLGAMQNLMSYNLRAPLFGMPRIDANGNPIQPQGMAAQPSSGFNGLPSQAPLPWKVTSQSLPPAGWTGGQQGVFSANGQSAAPFGGAPQQSQTATPGATPDMQAMAARVIRGEMPTSRADAGSLASVASLMGLSDAASRYAKYTELPEGTMPGASGGAVPDPAVAALAGAKEAATQAADVRYAGPKEAAIQAADLGYAGAISRAKAAGSAPYDILQAAARQALSPEKLEPTERLESGGSVMPQPILNAINATVGQVPGTGQIGPAGQSQAGNASDWKKSINPVLTPAQQEAEKGLGDNYTTEGAKTFQSAVDLKGSIEYIRRDLETMGPSGFLAAGSAANLRGEFARAINTASLMAGGEPIFDPNKVGAWEDFMKESTLGGMKGLSAIFGGSREAASIINSSIGAFPRPTNSYDGARLLVNAFDEAANHEVDRRTFETNMLAQPGATGMGVNEAFNQKYPAAMYARRAISMVKPYPIRDPAEASRYLPGTHVLTPSGQVKVVPGNPSLTLDPSFTQGGGQ